MKLKPLGIIQAFCLVSLVQNQVLQAIDGVCSHSELLLQHHDPVFSQLLPALSAAGGSSLAQALLKLQGW